MPRSRLVRCVCAAAQHDIDAPGAVSPWRLVSRSHHLSAPDRYTSAGRFAAPHRFVAHLLSRALYAVVQCPLQTMGSILHYRKIGYMGCNA